MAWYPCLHMSEIIARGYGTGSVNVSVNSLSHVTGAVWRHYTNIVSRRTKLVKLTDVAFQAFQLETGSKFRTTNHFLAMYPVKNHHYRP